MSERDPMLATDTNQPPLTPEDRLASLTKLVKNEALIEGGPSLEFIQPESLAEPGGNMYYGTGLTTPKAISTGLPFDILGMMLTADNIARAAGFDQVIHHIADTHAKTNDWIDPEAVDAISERTVRTLETIQKNLGLVSFKFVKSSTFDTTDDYKKLVDSFGTSAENEYVRREMADMEWYRTKFDVRAKMGWIIQAKETEMGFDERRFDREYLSFHPGKLSFIYTKPGRTFDTSRPKVSPYITIADESRLVLEPGTDVESVLNSLNDKSYGGARKHLQSIVRLYEGKYGNMGKIGADNVTLESKIQAIIDKCFAE